MNLRFAAVSLTLLLLGCGREKTVPAPAQGQSGEGAGIVAPVFTELATRLAGRGSTLFRKLTTTESGIDFVHKWEPRTDHEKQLLKTGFAGTATSANAASFLTPVSVTSSTEGTDLWPASNLIQGPGVGYDAAEPHNQLGSGPSHRWVTSDPGGYPSDYLSVAGSPLATFDMGANVPLSEISVWGYTNSNNNGVAQFSLRFATDAEGPGGFGASITYNPTFGGPPGAGAIPLDDLPRNSFGFSESVRARYVQFTVLDNWFIDPGGSGGDRVGLGEVAFAIPEPASMLLGGVTLLGLLRRRRA